MILQLKYMPIVMNPARIASSILEMLWSVMRLIFKTSLVTPDFFYVFSIILSFSTCSQSFKKICTREIFGANVLQNGFLCLAFQSDSISNLREKIEIFKAFNMFRTQSLVAFPMKAPLTLIFTCT